jgi:hypothetical protein
VGRMGKKARGGATSALLRATQDHWLCCVSYLVLIAAHPLPLLLFLLLGCLVHGRLPR